MRVARLVGSEAALHQRVAAQDRGGAEHRQRQVRRGESGGGGAGGVGGGYVIHRGVGVQSRSIVRCIRRGVTFDTLESDAHIHTHIDIKV